MLRRTVQNPDGTGLRKIRGNAYFMFPIERNEFFEQKFREGCALDPIEKIVPGTCSVLLFNRNNDKLPSGTNLGLEWALSERNEG